MLKFPSEQAKDKTIFEIKLSATAISKYNLFPNLQSGQLATQQRLPKPCHGKGRGLELT